MTGLFRMAVLWPCVLCQRLLDVRIFHICIPSPQLLWLNDLFERQCEEDGDMVFSRVMCLFGRMAKIASVHTDSDKTEAITVHF